MKRTAGRHENINKTFMKRTFGQKERERSETQTYILYELHKFPDFTNPQIQFSLEKFLNRKFKNDVCFAFQTLEMEN